MKVEGPGADPCRRWTPTLDGVEPAGSPSVGSEPPAGSPDPAPRSASGRAGALVLAVVLYVAARVVLVAVVTGVLVLVGLPLLVALLIALVVALPLSLVAFRPLRTRLNRELEAATATRRAHRERLRAELRGDDPSSP